MCVADLHVRECRKDLERLIVAGCGTSVNWNRSSSQSTPDFIICNALPDRENQLPGGGSQDARPAFVSSDWVLDSISNYELQETAKYRPA